MSTAGLLVPSKIQLLRVDIVKGVIDNPPHLAIEDLKGFNFDLGYFNGFNLDEKLVKTELEIRISSITEEQELPLATGSFRLAFLFHVDNLEELVRVGDQLEVNGSLGNAVASISYSTARGILLTRFQGTILKDFILPVIDPNVLLEPEYSLHLMEDKKTSG